MKNIIKRIYGKTVGALGALDKIQFNTRIITYHRVNPKFFEDQVRYLRDMYTITSLNKALENLMEKQVVITFDDGYKNNKTVAYPVLKKLGLKATLFVVTEFAESDVFAWWDRIESIGAKYTISRLKKMFPDEIEKFVERKTAIGKLSEKPEKYVFLSWEELIEVSDVFEIGSHGRTHAILTRLDPKAALSEILDSKRIIEKKTGMTIDSFAYPNGDYNDLIESMVEEAGYKCAVTYKGGNNSCEEQKFRLFRRGIHYDDNVDVFAAKVAGFL